MAAKESSLVLTFNDGITEGIVEDVAEGVITISENTRLTRLKGAAVKAPAIVPVAALGALDCGGLVSDGRDSTVMYFRPGEANTTRWSGGYPSSVLAADGSVGQNAYYPYPLTRAGAVPGGLSVSDPSTVVDASGRTWHFSVRIHNRTSYGLFVTVLDGDRVVVPPRYVTAAGTFWSGATAQTIVIGSGVVVWYNETPVATTMRARSLSLDTNEELVIDAEQTILTYTSGSYADVVSNGTDGFAYIMRRTSSTDLEIIKVNTATWTTSTTAIAGVVSASLTKYYALCLHTRGGVEYLTAAVSDSVNDTAVRHYTTSAMTLVWSRSNIATYGRVAVQPLVYGSDAFMVVAVDTFFTGNLGASGHTKTSFLSLNMSTGVVSRYVDVPWYKLHSRGAHRRNSDTAIHPYFPLMACDQTNAVYDTMPGYVLDPSIEVFTLKDTETPSPVMRCAVDRLLPLATDGRPMGSNGACARDGLLTLVYLEQRVQSTFGNAAAFPARYVTFDLRPAKSPATATDERGSTLIASGLTAYWDGCETSEHCPLHAPAIRVATSGGTGGTNLTGTYSFRAVISWRDANGLVRRSAPSLPYTVTLAGTKPQVYVTARESMRGRGLEEYEISLYATLVGGSIFYAQNYVVADKNLNGCWHFAAVHEPGAYNVRLYSTGTDNEPLLPSCPPPSSSVSIIGPRAWLIDAEDPYRLLPSLPKEQGVAYEFSPELAVYLPPTYGKAVAVADRSGQPFVFCERGVFAIGGYGPDATGQGAGFSEPTLVLPRGCRLRETVVSLPGVGIIFQADDGRFALIGSGFKSFDMLGIYDVGAPLVFQQENEVAYPRTDGEGWVVYNWVKDAWTKWTTTVGGEAPTHSAVTSNVDGSVRALLYGASTGTLATLDTTSETALPLRVERGWIAPQLPQGDCVIREVWVQCLREGGHALRVTVGLDYDDDLLIEQEWTSTELVALTQTDRYTVGLHCEARQARSLKIKVEEFSEDGNPLTGAGVRVLTATVFYGATSSPRRRTLLEGALK